MTNVWGCDTGELFATVMLTVWVGHLLKLCCWEASTWFFRKGHISQGVRSHSHEYPPGSTQPGTKAPEHHRERTSKPCTSLRELHSRSLFTSNNVCSFSLLSKASNNWPVGVTQLGECLPHMHSALGSIPSTKVINQLWRCTAVIPAFRRWRQYPDSKPSSPA